MSPEHLRKQLLYRSLHRGCKETDILIGEFAKAHLDSFSEQELQEYQTLLEAADADIYNWICNQETIPPGINQELIEHIIKFNQRKIDAT